MVYKVRALCAILKLEFSALDSTGYLAAVSTHDVRLLDTRQRHCAISMLPKALSERIFLCQIRIIRNGDCREQVTSKVLKWPF